MKTWIILVLLIIAQKVNSQTLMDFKINPTNPTNNDSIMATFYIHFTWDNAKKQNGYLSIVNDTIIYEGCYFKPGFVQSSSYVYDTVSIGKLSAGYYPFYLLRKYVFSAMDTDCINIAYTDTLDTFIVVSPVSSVDRPVKNPLHIVITGAQLTLTIPPPTQPTTATITDINGRLLRKETLLNATNTLNIAELPAGLYFIAVQNAEQRWVRRFVKQ